jgi:thymidylate synthase (FAD)
MKIELVGITGSIGAYAESTPESLITHMARVSNPSNQNTAQDSDKLIRYLIKNQHWSPFEMVNIVMEINVQRDIARQILRHRSFSFQEFSQRYADPTKELSFDLREARLQDKKNRQNSIEIDDKELDHEWKIKQMDAVSHALNAYNWAIENGIAKEQARAVLPEGITMSRMYMNGTLRSWIHYCQLRMANGTQKEHMEVAKACWDIIGKHFPNVIKALEQ